MRPDSAVATGAGSHVPNLFPAMSKISHAFHIRPKSFQPERVESNQQDDGDTLTFLQQHSALTCGLTFFALES